MTLNVQSGRGCHHVAIGEMCVTAPRTAEGCLKFVVAAAVAGEGDHNGIVLHAIRNNG